MHRSVRSTMSFTIHPGQARIALMIAVAKAPGLDIDETWRVSADGEPLDPLEVEAPHRGRIHIVDLEVAQGAASHVDVEYTAEIHGQVDQRGEPAPDPDPADLLTYIRPSRYAESDQLLPTAQALFAGLHGVELLNAVAAHTYEVLSYVPGSSRFTDGAVQTLLSRQGVCRDYAHLVVGLLRGLDVPARLTAVYAPGLTPMDFHAVAEAWVEGAWHAVDATRMAPRQGLLRISTGRDAADTAFLSAHGARVQMTGQSIVATTEGKLPADDHVTAFRLP